MKTTLEHILVLLDKANKLLTTIFVVVLFVGISFYFRYGYYDIAFAKWDYYLLVTLGNYVREHFIPGFLFVMSIIECCKLVFELLVKRIKIRISLLDIIVLSYFFIVCISRNYAFDKWVAIWGYEGWFMGFYAQLSFVLIYYFVSRYFSLKKDFLIGFMSITIIVYFLEVLNRFWIYIPPQLADGILLEELQNFVSTIGNINWFASYMAVTMPMGYVLFLFSKDKDIQTISIIHVIVGAMAFVTQNSQSLFVPFCVLLIILWINSSNDAESLSKYSLLLCVAFISFRIIGILQVFFFENHVVLDANYQFLCQSVFSFVLMIAFGISAYLLKQRPKQFEHIKRIYKYSIYAVIICFLLYVVIVNLIDIPQHYVINLLRFNDSWGTNRGEIWKISIQTILRMFHQDPVRILFGCGPDNYKFAVYYYSFDEVKIHWYNTILKNAHNEWLTSIMNYGLVGGVLYLGIFTYSLKESYSRSHMNGIGIMLFSMVLGYFMNNMFSFQQVISTPIVFMIIGLIKNWTNQLSLISDGSING